MAASVFRSILFAALAAVACGPGALSALSLSAGQAGAPDPQVRGVLFSSPQCPHCADVLRDHLPPLLERYGEALRIVVVNVEMPEGQALYQAVARHFELPRQRLGVPALVVGERMLVGAWEIPAHLPGLVDAGLAGTGVDWPAIPEVRAFLALHGISEGPVLELESWMVTAGSGAAGDAVVRLLSPEGGSGEGSVSERFMSDPLGNGIAVVVLIVMVAVLTVSLRTVYRPKGRLREWPAWAIPALALVGVGLSSYLAFVEVSGVQAVCGPVGDCNRVQLSAYATIAGVSVGVLGVIGYLVLGGLAVLARSAWGGSRRLPLLLWGTAAAGVVFSIYLTFLEPFVIGATCMWCINSAVVMTLILMLATPDAVAARLDANPRAARASRAHRATRAVGRAPAARTPNTMTGRQSRR
jgi:uncharacterized membrane protein